MIQAAIEVEVRELISQYSNVRTLTGAAAVVRNGYLPAHPSKLTAYAAS